MGRFKESPDTYRVLLQFIGSVRRAPAFSPSLLGQAFNKKDVFTFADVLSTKDENCNFRLTRRRTCLLVIA